MPDFFDPKILFNSLVYSLLGVVVVFLGAARDILTRYVPGHVPGSVIAFGNLVGAGLASLALAWNEGGLTLPPDAASWFIGTSSGLCVALGLIVLIKSLRLAPMSVTAPFRRDRRGGTARWW